MEGWNDGRGSSSWSYRHEIDSNVSSSRSGTIASGLSSAAYASSGSRFSPFSMDLAAMKFGSLGIHGDVNGNNMGEWDEEEEEETGEAHITRRLRILVQEYFSAPSANRSIKHGDVDRWLMELGVGWVLHLHLDDGPSAVEQRTLRPDNAQSWIWALSQIAETIRPTASPFFPDRGCRGLPSICVVQGEHVGGRCILDRYHLALFIQETILKMLPFVDVLVAWVPNKDRVLPLTIIFILRGVHDALFSLSEILELSDSATSVEVKSIEKAIYNLLPAYTSKVGDAIWSTMEKARTTLLEDDKDSSTSVNPQGPADIHKVTRSVMTYIRQLWANYSSLDAAIRGNKSVPRIENVQPLDSVIMEMVSCLQEKLANISDSFPDQGLRFLFLLNNSNCIQQTHNLLQCSLQQPRSKIDIDLTHKIEDLMERYLQVSWAPLLSCLFNPTPLCLGNNRSPLSKFESEFQKIYSTQIEWKVPDPVLRRRLCNLITDKIIPVYTEYIEDNKVTNPKFSPQELKAMLQELFEG